MQQGLRQVLGLDLKCSESGVQDKFMRDEIARQSVLAELPGQKLAPPKK